MSEQPSPRERQLPSVAIIGAGPAGLMAAQTAARAGQVAAVFDAMPSPGRKFLLAGKGGLNLTHSEPFEGFLGRYGRHAGSLAPHLRQFGPQELRAWADGLGIDTFVGTSGRVFPSDFKAAPLLRAWLRHLRGLGVQLHVRHRWLGWAKDGSLLFATPTGEMKTKPKAVVLAMGGASWPKLGSDGAWVDVLAGKGVEVSALAPANCGFDVGWSEHLKQRFAGTPVKPVALSFQDRTVKGEIIVTETGLEGGPVYALSAALRDAIAGAGEATLVLDLKPDWDEDRLTAALSAPRGSRSVSTHLSRTAGLGKVAIALLHETATSMPASAGELARRIKALELRLKKPRPIAEAISTAGGIDFGGLTGDLMLKAMPGVFAAGEMLDWEAPTGGYLLTACLATGRTAGQAAADWAARA